MSTGQSKPTILVVDDNPASLDMYGMLFPLYGFQVIRAKSGEEGLIAIKNNVIDLIMLDLWGIGMEPYDFIHQVNAQRELKIPIVLFSAGPLQHINMLLKEPGVKWGVQIPHKPQLIAEKIKEVLGLK